jgi:hypothetical protein
MLETKERSMPNKTLKMYQNAGFEVRASCPPETVRVSWIAPVGTCTLAGVEGVPTGESFMQLYGSGVIESCWYNAEIPLDALEPEVRQALLSPSKPYTLTLYQVNSEENADEQP